MSDKNTKKNETTTATMPIRIDEETYNYLQTKKIIEEEPTYKVIRRLIGLDKGEEKNE